MPLCLNHSSIHSPIAPHTYTCCCSSHRATWLCQLLVLNTKPSALRDVPHTQEVENQLQVSLSPPPGIAGAVSCEVHWPTKSHDNVALFTP